MCFQLGFNEKKKKNTLKKDQKFSENLSILFFLYVMQTATFFILRLIPFYIELLKYLGNYLVLGIVSLNPTGVSIKFSSSTHKWQIA